MKNKRLLFRIIVVAVLILIIIYTFRDSADSILAQLTTTPLYIVVAICLSSVIYHMFEAWITYSLARRYNSQFRYRTAVYCAFNCSFYRLSTLGSGSGVAAVIFLGRNGVGYSEATGLYMVQYVVHKVSVAIFSGIFFVLNWSFMSKNYSEYGIYLILAYLLTALIALGLILFAVSAKFHRFILTFGKRFNKSGRFDKLLDSLEKNCAIMETSTFELIRDVKTLLIMVLKNMIKLCFWYCIPWIVLFSGHELSLINSLSVTSLSVMTAAVIPTPAGIGSVELIMTSLIGLLVGVDKSAAITVLYRVATFIFPFAAGGALILVHRLVLRRH